MDGGVFNVLLARHPEVVARLGCRPRRDRGATGVLFVLGAIPMSSLSDRTSRKRLIAITMSVWAWSSR
jgi:hypothetical protein